jgi:thioredoxin 1
MIAPSLEEIARENPEITIGKINVDHDMELAMQFQVASIPLLVVMKDGQIVNKALGAMPKADILALLP